MDLQKLRKLAGIVESSAPKKKMLKEYLDMDIPDQAKRLPTSSVSAPMYIFITEAYSSIDLSIFLQLFGYKLLRSWADQDELAEDNEFFGLSEEEAKDLVEDHFPDNGSGENAGLAIYTTTGNLEDAAQILKKSKFQVVITFS